MVYGRFNCKRDGCVSWSLQLWVLNKLKHVQTHMFHTYRQWKMSKTFLRVQTHMFHTYRHTKDRSVTSKKKKNPQLWSVQTSSISKKKNIVPTMEKQSKNGPSISLAFWAYILNHLRIIYFSLNLQEECFSWVKPPSFFFSRSIPRAYLEFLNSILMPICAQKGAHHRAISISTNCAFSSKFTTQCLVILNKLKDSQIPLKGQ